MSSVTERLHNAFLDPLQSSLIRHSKLADKPLVLDLKLPSPPRLRVYMYSLVGGIGERTRREYKAVLRVRGLQSGEYASFDHSGGRVALLVGYRSDLDVFVLWDTSLHSNFTNGWNIQVKDSTVHNAAATGRADQVRSLSNKTTEIVIACQSWNLRKAINDRIAWTGGMPEREWETLRN